MLLGCLQASIDQKKSQGIHKSVIYYFMLHSYMYCHVFCTTAGRPVYTCYHCMSIVITANVSYLYMIN